MNNRLILAFVLLALNLASLGQQTTGEINRSDTQGRKQGYWIKKYPNGNIQYTATFRDDKPVGEFKRYNEDNSIRSILIYSADGNEADAEIFHPNGFISARGKYIGQMKEGKWSFYSYAVEGCLLNEEYYHKNIRNGLSQSFYPDSTIAERFNYINGLKDGEWIQYHTNGKIFIRANYVNDILQGKFEAWYDDGKQEYSGNYKDNLRDGTWKFWNDDGSVRYTVVYVRGVTDNKEMEKESAAFFEKIERNKGKIADPEKTGQID